MKFEHVIRAAASLPWAIMPEKAAEIAAVLELRASGQRPSDEVLADLRAEAATRFVEHEAAATSGAPSQGGSVAIIPLIGIVSQRTNLMAEMSGPGGTSTQKFATAFRQAMADPNVAAIVIDVDSPGGSVFGVQELAAEIRAARSRKPIVAQANSLMASAAYWIGSAAGEIVGTPGGQIGSIGVLAIHVDRSAANEAEGLKPTLIKAGKYKAEGSPDFPLTDDAQAFMQDQVDAYYAAFLSAVAAGRGVGVDRVRSAYGEGRVLLAQQALKAGMIDRIGTLEETVSRMLTPSGRAAVVRKGQSAGTYEQDVTAFDDPEPVSIELPTAAALDAMLAKQRSTEITEDDVVQARRYLGLDDPEARRRRLAL